jgi:lipoprotein-anchoring transpeptidase ErfK/SrfK
MRERQPGLPEKMIGGLSNPLGGKEIYLGNSLYRIHSTNDSRTIGQAASSGCFRMLNTHVVHLADLVEIGTTVKVVDRWPTGEGVARTNARKQRPGRG